MCDCVPHRYEAILAKHPTYTDCYLRLSCMARADGHLNLALEHLQHALTVHTDLADALSMQGNIHLERREYFPAQRRFERVLEKVDSRDAYALLSLGNMYYMASFERKERVDRERYMKHASDSFWRVLSADPTCLYAANGMGMILAEEGRLGAAQDIFMGVREGTNAMPDVLVNLAHIYIARGDFQKAITLYENALRKHHDNANPKLILYLARAHFEVKILLFGVFLCLFFVCFCFVSYCLN
jgi:RNA polymerase-associated protein CTR9